VAALACYLRLAGTQAVNSDGAAQALQAWDVLHGNLLLHGWTVSDVSFYTTELPEYVLVDFCRGLIPDVVHVAAAITYTLVVLLAALLAKSTATGRAALVRVLVAVGIMVAPQLPQGIKHPDLLAGPHRHLGADLGGMAHSGPGPGPAGGCRWPSRSRSAGRPSPTSWCRSSACCCSSSSAWCGLSTPWVSSGRNYAACCARPGLASVTVAVRAPQHLQVEHVDPAMPRPLHGRTIMVFKIQTGRLRPGSGHPHAGAP
jgi:hypothetical protein